MTGPVPEEYDEGLDILEPPADEHPSELPDEHDTGHDVDQEDNAGSSLDQPSDDIT